MSKTIIEIDDNNICKIICEDNVDMRINKYITFSDLFSLMNSSYSKIEKMQKQEISEILPGDSIISTIQVINLPDIKSKWYILVRERIPHDMELEGVIYKKCGMPRTIYAVKVCNDKCVALRIACVKDNLITNKTTIYKYPFSNTFDTTGICLGGNSISEFTLKDLSNIAMIPEMFLSMPNNQHGYHTANKSNLKYDELLNSLECKKFNDDFLVESYQSKTYQIFIRSLK